MASIQEKVNNGRIESFKFRVCIGRDEQGKQIFRCKTWIPDNGLTKAKSRKAASLAAAAWEEEVKLDFTLGRHQERVKERITFSRFVNDMMEEYIEEYNDMLEIH